MPYLPDIDECIQGALSELESADSVRRNGTHTYDIYLDLIEKNLNGEEFPLTKGEFEERLHRILVQSIGSEDPVRTFHEQKADLLRDAAISEESQWTVLFPLELYQPQAVSIPQTLQCRKVELQNVRPNRVDEYDDRFDDSNGESKRYQGFKDHKLSDGWNSDEWSFWKYNIKAQSANKAIRNAERDLEIILAKMNLALVSEKYPTIPEAGQDIVGGLEPEGVVSPICFLLFGEESEAEFKLGRNLSPRSPQPIPEGWKDNVESYPDFSAVHPLDESILPALRAFQQAQAANEYDSRFLNYWRGIESANTFMTDDNIKTERKVDRATTFSYSIDLDLLEYRIEKIRKKRNELVHQAAGPDIYMQDINFLKRILVNEISGLFELRGRDEKDKHPERARNIMDRGRSGEDDIQDEIDKLQNDKESLHAVLDWRDRVL